MRSLSATLPVLFTVIVVFRIGAEIYDSGWGWRKGVVHLPGEVEAAHEQRGNRPQVVTQVVKNSFNKTTMSRREKTPKEIRTENLLRRNLTEEATNYEALNVEKHHWTIGVCGSTSDSSQWLREWIELLLLSDVGHVFLFDDNKNGQDNETAVILEDYEARGFVTVIPFRLPVFLPECKGMWVESDCILPKMCYRHASKYVDHLGVVDTDEFMFANIGCSLEEHIVNNCNAAQAYEFLRWVRFGTSGHYHHPVGLMSENFLSSGGDCSAHDPSRTKYIETTCKLPFEPCMECRQQKVLYNVGKCIQYNQVGWVHEPVNTTYWINANKMKPHLPIQTDSDFSQFKAPDCIERHFLDNGWECRFWMNEGGGRDFPLVPHHKCCGVGFGYNHYGTKSLESWQLKQAKRTRRGFKPTDFSTIELNVTISTSILRYTRALRERFTAQNYPVSPGVSFIDIPRGSCFTEVGYQYIPDESQGSYQTHVTTVSDTTGCCSACFEFENDSGRCGGWSFDTDTSSCYTLYAPYKAWRNGTELKHIKWPRDSIPAQRVKVSGFVSGIPLWQGECALRPKHKIRK